MKAWEIEGDFGIENLNLVEKDDPDPGFGEVIVGVRACSLNFRDYQVVMGQYDPKMPLPEVLSNVVDRSMLTRRPSPHCFLPPTHRF